MSDSLLRDDDYNMWVLLYRTMEAIYKARQKELSQYGTSVNQAAVLFTVLAVGDKANPAEIARWLFREPHSVSELLSRMEKDGFVKKVKNFDRKNLVRITLTEKGKHAFDHSNKRESIHKIMSVLSEKKRRQLRSGLMALRDKALEELGMPPMPYPYGTQKNET